MNTSSLFRISMLLGLVCVLRAETPGEQGLNATPSPLEIPVSSKKRQRPVSLSFENDGSDQQASNNTASSAQPVQRKKRQKLVSLNFENEDLVTIINYLAAQKKINVILPPPPNIISTKVSLHYQKKVPLDEAFTLLNTILDMSGYMMLPHGNTYIISRADVPTSREALPIYIGVEAEKLPDSDERIRYLYYFDNIKIPPGGAGQAQEIKAILDDMLQEPGRPGSAQIIFDSATNCVIITAKAYSIKVAMQIIGELDKTGFREVVEVVKMVNTSASFVGKFINEQLLAPAAQPGFIPVPPSFDAGYFAKTTKVIPDVRANSLILLGRAQAVERLRDFIYKYIDVSLESGESLIHVFELQYLDAQKFAEDLRVMIRPKETAAGQSKGTLEERAFQGVIIEAERVGAVDALKTQVEGVGVGTVVQGGNRLLVAAKKTDWVALKRLILLLDKPQPQVSLEVLIVDVDLGDDRQLGSQMRNKTDAFPKEVNAQVATLDSPVLDSPAKTLITDLLKMRTADGDTFNLATLQSPGSLILSVNDIGNNGIWWVAQVLKSFTNSKILSHPHIVTLNQQRAVISRSENRVVDGNVKATADANIVIPKVTIKADLQVEILPRINLSNGINLQIIVNVNDFLPGEGNARTTRTVVTNATVGNGEILVLGGLVKTSEKDDAFSTPPISKIPIIGWLFKSRAKSIKKDNLMIFIAPTVIKPKMGGGMSDMSSEKFAYGKDLVDQGELFDQVKDPITHWFFSSPQDSAKGTAHEYEAGAMFGDQPLKGGEVKRPKAQGKNNVQQPSEYIASHHLKSLLSKEKNPLLAQALTL